MEVCARVTWWRVMVVDGVLVLLSVHVAVPQVVVVAIIGCRLADRAAAPTATERTAAQVHFISTTLILF